MRGAAMTRFDAIIIGAGQAGPVARRTPDRRRHDSRARSSASCSAAPASTPAACRRRRSSPAPTPRISRGAPPTTGSSLNGAVRIDMPQVKARADAVSANARTGVEKWLREHAELHGHRRATRVRGAGHRSRRRRAADRAAHLHQRRRTRARAGHARRSRRPVSHEHDDAGAGPACPASGGGRRQLRRPRVRADVPALRRRGDGRREGAAADRAAKTTTCRQASGRSWRPKASRSARGAECISLAPHAAGCRGLRRLRGGPPGSVGSHVLLAVGRRPNTDDLGLDRAGVAVDERGYITVDDSLRDERARDLGARRLQRPRRVHPHGLQRLRDRRGQPARRRDSAGSASAFRPTRSTSIRRSAASA